MARVVRKAAPPPCNAAIVKKVPNCAAGAAGAGSWACDCHRPVAEIDRAWCRGDFAACLFPSRSVDSVESAIADIAAGRLIIVTDDEDRENEGDLIMAASKASRKR